MRWFFFARQKEICMTLPTHEVVADLVSRLDSSLREAFEERAAIREFDGGLNRELAEALALLELIRQYPKEVLSLLT
jgi:hypothetical protein